MAGSVTSNSATVCATQSTYVTVRPGVGGESCSCVGEREGDKNGLCLVSPPAPLPGVGGEDKYTTGVPEVGGVGARSSRLVSPGVGGVSRSTMKGSSVPIIVVCSADSGPPGVGGVSGLTTSI